MKTETAKAIRFCLFLSAIVMVFAVQGNAQLNGSAIAVWLFDEGRGGESNDLSGNGNTATLINGPKWVDGKFGSGIDFDGSDDFVSIGESQDWDIGSGDFTIMLWFFPRAERKTALITSATDYWAGIMFHNVGTRNICIWASSGGKFWDIIHSDPGGTGIGNVSVPLNEWSHAAYVRSGNQWKSYVNGVEDVSVTGEGPLVDRTNEEKIIGRWGNPNDRGWFDGIIDEVAIFGAALSEDDIGAVMDSGLEEATQGVSVEPAGKIALSWGWLKAAE